MWGQFYEGEGDVMAGEEMMEAPLPGREGDIPERAERLKRRGGKRRNPWKLG